MNQPTMVVLDDGSREWFHTCDRCGKPEIAAAEEAYLAEHNVKLGRCACPRYATVREGP